MKRFVLFVFVVLCIGSLLAGCGMVKRPSERVQSFRNIDDIRARQFVDDCDYVGLYDRPSYLTEWPVRDTD
ncbi:MAG: hypothetical protein SVV80_11450 [Planctomycetota bacterium]|nr:hypothetical protein [Planctomycetota bacterium]